MKNYSRKPVVSYSLGSLKSTTADSNSSSVIHFFRRKEDRNILMLCTDLTAKTSKHIIDAACVLSNYDFKTTIITCRYHRKICANMKETTVIVLRPRIPESIFGCFKSMLYVIRSAYVALWTLMWSPVLKPAVVFCEADRIVIPLLYLGNYKIVYFQYCFNILTKNTPVKNTLIKTSYFTNKCMQCADVILVPNMQYKWIFKHSLKNVHINPLVMYPHLRTSHIENQELCSLRSYFPFMKHNSYVFLAVGQYDERSNFELAVRAFEHLILIADEEKKNDLYLIVYGHYSKHLTSDRNYFRKIKRLVNSSKSAEQFILLEYSALCEKLSLIFGCTVLLHTTIDEIFNKCVLEAMFLKKAVIATRTGFMKEVIKDGITGFLTEPNIVHFAVAMNKFVTTPKIADIMGNIGHIEFIRRYSFESYGERLMRVIYEYGVISESRRYIGDRQGKRISKEEARKFFR